MTPEAVIKLSKALGDPTRFRILQAIAATEEIACGALAARFPITQATCSQHLKVLKDARLVRDRRAGKQRIYSVDAIGLGAFRAELDQFWSKALAVYKAAVEDPSKEVL